MINIANWMILLALAAAIISWVVPRALALDAVAVWTGLVLIALSPPSAFWLLATAIGTPLVMKLGDRTRRRGLAAAIWSLILLAAFATSRFSNGPLWIGGAFFTLRALHVVGDWWTGRLPVPTIRAHLRYQLFLPVIASGPINRFEVFAHQVQRRRWDTPMFLEGMERTLVGVFSIFVIGGWLVKRATGLLETHATAWTPFARDWSHAVLDWVSLYFVFAGFSSVAIGISLMIGLRLEENFNRPWAAHNLIDFWMRWHMTLTRWCRDYVFRPVTAVTRNAFVGLCVAMLVVGLWHEFSRYYILWSVWQVLGVVLTRLAMRWLPLERLPWIVRAIFGPLFVLAWLSLSRPVLMRFLEAFS